MDTFPSSGNPVVILNPAANRGKMDKQRAVVRDRAQSEQAKYIETTRQGEAKELAMDATFGTNNAGMDLFAVLAELDGTGIPLAYIFVETLPSEDSNRRSDPGATTHILSQFIYYLKDSGFNPIFFGTDKDHSEISAVKAVWPNVSIQLCY